MALGATRASIMRFVFGAAARIGVVGIAAGEFVERLLFPLGW